MSNKNSGVDHNLNQHYTDEQGSINLNARLMESKDNNLILILCIGLILGILIFSYFFGIPFSF